MDETVLFLVNGYAAQSEMFDKLVRLVANSPLIKGVPIAVLFLFLWFRQCTDQDRKRLGLVALLVVSVAAIVVGRAAAALLPYRPRPLHAEALDLQMPLSVTPGTLEGWSSFPSDHAVFYAALATGFWMVSRNAGLLVLLHALIVIAFSRVFLLLHYPSDILGGAVIGLVVGLVLMRPVSVLVQWAGIVGIAERWPQFFYPLLFIALFQISTMFASARQLAQILLNVLT